jgi:hypothetical protein
VLSGVIGSPRDGGDAVDSTVGLGGGPDEDSLPAADSLRAERLAQSL